MTRETLNASLRGAREIIGDLGHMLGRYILGAIALLIASVVLIMLIGIIIQGGLSIP